jgi:hypothetical protein
MLDRIKEAETIENVRDLTKDLSEFKPAEVRRISQEAKEKIKFFVRE